MNADIKNEYKRVTAVAFLKAAKAADVAFKAAEAFLKTAKAVDNVDSPAVKAAIKDVVKAAATATDTATTAATVATVATAATRLSRLVRRAAASVSVQG